MKTLTRTISAAAIALALSACVQSTSTPPPAQSVPPPPDQTSAMRTGGLEDERACLDAVANETNNSVAVLSSEFSEANTLVMVGVGPERAPWRCLVSKGRVAEVMSTVDEGAL